MHRNKLIKSQKLLDPWRNFHGFVKTGMDPRIRLEVYKPEHFLQTSSLDLFFRNAWKTSYIVSQMVVVQNGDESHGRIRKEITKKTNPR